MDIEQLPGDVDLAGHCQTIPVKNDNAAHVEKFEPTWPSLAHYKVPEWFRNAKFGIWAHWGP